jgi:hypothetical protein
VDGLGPTAALAYGVLEATLGPTFGHVAPDCKRRRAGVPAHAGDLVMLLAGSGAAQRQIHLIAVLLLVQAATVIGASILFWRRWEHLPFEGTPEELCQHHGPRTRRLGRRLVLILLSAQPRQVSKLMGRCT